MILELQIGNMKNKSHPLSSYKEGDSSYLEDDSLVGLFCEGG
jgi:hypothetical protein